MVQIAEQATASETIEATLSYFIDTDAMPAPWSAPPAAATSGWVAANRTPTAW